MTFGESIKKEVPQDIQEFCTNVEKAFKKHFPNGYAQVRFQTNLTEAIVGRFGMIGTPKDNTNGIPENDKMPHAFIMFRNGDAWEFKVSKSNIYLNPAEGSLMAMDSIRTKMGNNSNITLDKAQVKLEKFFKKLSGIMKDNVQNIHGVENINKKYLVFK